MVRAGSGYSALQGAVCHRTVPFLAPSSYDSIFEPNKHTTLDDVKLWQPAVDTGFFSHIFLLLIPLILCAYSVSSTPIGHSAAWLPQPSHATACRLSSHHEAKFVAVAFVLHRGRSCAGSSVYLVHGMLKGLRKSQKSRRKRAQSYGTTISRAVRRRGNLQFDFV